ncbi:hypothetical protein FA10DRAFT_257912 [Acaromyces ingoldii]|uniref:Uncharacterized protein n=1 Tax=Acaromyces ingoldii TaxID=215250 RepID=A0A316Z0N5_9BASI|nr:hypothetical protein FA10DRAFT_257912 [Acaromyces ingoldii]PWN93665.1 hypothetical protein FA10DRAFT_257912 [Acaromyces ingoldii]
MAQGLMHLFILGFLVFAQASMLQARPAPPDDDDEGPSHHPYELGDVGQIFHELPDASQSFHELPDKWTPGILPATKAPVAHLSRPHRVAMALNKIALLSMKKNIASRCHPPLHGSVQILPKDFRKKGPQTPRKHYHYFIFPSDSWRALPAALAGRYRDQIEILISKLDGLSEEDMLTQIRHFIATLRNEHPLDVQRAWESQEQEKEQARKEKEQARKRKEQARKKKKQATADEDIKQKRRKRKRERLAANRVSEGASTNDEPSLFSSPRLGDMTQESWSKDGADQDPSSPPDFYRPLPFIKRRQDGGKTPLIPSIRDRMVISPKSARRMVFEKRFEKR